MEALALVTARTPRMTSLPANHRLSTCCAKKIGVTRTAQPGTISLRATLAEKPRFIIADDGQPPAMLPRSEMRWASSIQPSLSRTTIQAAFIVHSTMSSGPKPALIRSPIGGWLAR